MSKIQTIKLSNFKSISDLEVNFKGCTAIITGGNNKGKTSFLRGIPDRIRFVRPDVMVKQGNKEGKGELTLTSGEKFVWDFDTNGRDKLTYITFDGSQRQSVTKELGSSFFPVTFDIDKFLQSPPKNQAKQLQAIVGLDFTDIDKRYEVAYNKRTELNREAEIYHVKLEKMLKAPHVEFVDLTELTAKKEAEKNKLNAKYQENKKANQAKREEWEKEKSFIDNQVIAHNKAEVEKVNTLRKCQDAIAVLIGAGYKGNEAFEFVTGLEEDIQPGQKASELYPAEPTYIEEMPDRSELDKIDSEIIAASETNAAAQKYKEYADHKNATEAAKQKAEDADRIVKEIESERHSLIASCSMPEGISITPEGILVDGLPLDRNQISTSKLYTAALRIASMGLGEVRTLYFDASFLDKNSLGEIEKWASENDLQLLIERPDFDGGEIQYELIETV